MNNNIAIYIKHRIQFGDDQEYTDRVIILTEGCLCEYIDMFGMIENHKYTYLRITDYDGEVKRDDYHRMMVDAKRGDFRYLVVFEPYDIGCSSVSRVNFLRTMSEYGIEVVIYIIGSAYRSRMRTDIDTEINRTRDYTKREKELIRENEEMWDRIPDRGCVEQSATENEKSLNSRNVSNSIPCVVCGKPSISHHERSRYIEPDGKQTPTCEGCHRTIHSIRDRLYKQKLTEKQIKELGRLINECISQREIRELQQQKKEKTNILSHLLHS